MVWPIISKLIGGETAKEIIGGVGAAVNNVLDRFVPKKISEAEKWNKVKDVIALENERAGTEVIDVNKSRDMWMAFLRTQKIPWLPRFLNSMYRPFAGFIALGYLTDGLWAQILTNLIDGFVWIRIERDPIVDGLVAVIIYFFFGYRHKAKDRGITGIN